MKKQIISFIALVITSLAVGQNGFNYKALISDNGNVMTNQVVSFKFTVVENGTNSVYQEIQTGNTDTNGIIAFNIGEGSVVSGDFSTIDWGNNTYFLKVEINTGNGYQDFGTSELKYVPYAKYADKAGNVFSGNFNNLTNVPAGLSDGDDIDDADHDPANEIQNLSVNGNQLSISQGNTVTLSTGATKLDELNDARSDNDGSDNGSSIFIGIGAGDNDDQTDNGNVGLGYRAMNANTTGNFNTTSGYKALYSNITGSGNTASGYEALYHNTTGSLNIAIGSNALFLNTDRSNLVAVGDSVLYHNGQGATNTWEAVHNTAMGSKAMYYNTTGNWNTASGSNTLYSNTSGYSNSAFGGGALYSNTTGNDNAAFGLIALYSNITGYNNTAFGNGVLYHNTTGNNNTAYGTDALSHNITGYNNTALGYLAFYVGDNHHNSTAIGYNAYISASNQVRIGDVSVSSIGGYANWSNVSDVRFKTDVQENVPGLVFIKKLRPVTYHLNVDAIVKFTKTPESARLTKDEQLKATELQTGFIAQEVEQAANSIGYDFSGVDKPKNKEDYYALRYAEFVVPLVKAVQEQQAIIERLKQKLGEQETKSQEQEKRIQALEKILLNKNKQ